MAKKKVIIKKKAESTNKKNTNQILAIICLILNMVLLPGLGSLIGGKTKQGIWQLILFIGGIFLGIILTITILGAIIGIPLMIIAPFSAWIWGIVTGAKLIKESK